MSEHALCLSLGIHCYLACNDAARCHRTPLQDKEESVRSVQRGFGAQNPLGPDSQPLKANARKAPEPFYQASLAIHGASGFSGWEYRTMSTRPQTIETANERQPAVHKGDVRADEVPVDDSLSKITELSVPHLASVAPVERTDAAAIWRQLQSCLLYTSPSPRDRTRSRMPSSA